MGLYGHSSCSALDARAPYVPPQPPLPNPKRFVIGRHEAIGRNLVVCIVYPDCPTWEGRKVMVFECCTLADLMRHDMIDPHFAENRASGVPVPVARCEPTDRGWQLARIVAAAL